MDSITGAQVTLRYVHTHDTPDPQVRERLSGLKNRYGARVRLEFEKGSEVAGPSTLYVLRGEDIVSQAAGRDLPMRELHRVVDCALEWPH